jgi:hypothetical protein
MECIYLAQDGDQWRVLLSTMMKEKPDLNLPTKQTGFNTVLCKSIYGTNRVEQYLKSEPD